MNEDRLSQLIDSWHDDDLSEEQAEELNHILRESKEARRVFSAETQLHGLLHCAAAEDAIERVADIPTTTLQNGSRTLRGRSRPAWLMLVSAIAAGLIVAVAIQWWHSSSTPISVATLESSENAAWESELPTMPGSRLSPGILSLRTGVATVRFHSGAEVVVEAPAQLALLSPMRGKLLSGAAVVDVPDSAIGFVLETPDGYAVDYGTRFAVRVDQEEQQSNFEVIEGEIAVHHSKTGDEVRLIGHGKAVTVSERSIDVVDLEQRDEVPEHSQDVIRIGTHGRTGSAMRRDHKRHKFIQREFLSVKRTDSGKWDYQSFFAFDVSAVDFDQVESARLRLNLVPSTRGLASRLPKINRFGIYGLTNREKEDWQFGASWDDSPGPADGVRLGSFEVPRSVQRGTFGIQNDELLNFLKANRDRPVTLILVRETTQIEGVGAGLTHLFASDSHPEAVGPMLELTVNN
ncbi:FecR domain-containing protein [Thalassoroseus pseudoceratinae]|uniref:FecR domain-containing protein n=1 Tax=Thalassoroseus pseudoceratinae TaxID=2713176 RepID=UPI0014215DEA|nr:FecR domain-containing protein [Thalassoroseus pseudoceratinae]